MVIIEKVIDLYKNDTMTMIQLNGLIAFISVLVYRSLQDRKNPLSRQVLKRVAMGDNANKSFLSNVFPKIGEAIDRKVRLSLAKSELDFTPKEYIFITGLGMAAFFVLGFALLPFPTLFKYFVFIGKNTIVEIFFARILAGITFSFIGLLVPTFVIKYRIRKKKKDMEKQLINFILSMADGIRSARTPQEALRAISTDLPDPLSTELVTAVREIDFSIPYETALENLAERIDISEFSLILSAMQIQSQTGGHLESMLRNAASVAEERREIKGEVLKTVRETESMAYFLAAAPFIIFAGLAFMMKEEFLGQLFSIMGLIFLAVILIGWGFSVFLLYLIIKNVRKIL